MQRSRSFLLGLIFVTTATLRPVEAQTNSFKQTNLISDTSGMAANTDQRLVNPWGIAFAPGKPAWVANNRSGTATVYDGNGKAHSHARYLNTGGQPNPARWRHNGR